MNGANARNYRNHRVEVKRRQKKPTEMYPWEAVITKDGRHKETIVGWTEDEVNAHANECIDEMIERQ